MSTGIVITLPPPGATEAELWDQLADAKRRELESGTVEARFATRAAKVALRRALSVRGPTDAA